MDDWLVDWLVLIAFTHWELFKLLLTPCLLENNLWKCVTMFTGANKTKQNKN